VSWGLWGLCVLVGVGVFYGWCVLTAKDYPYDEEWEEWGE
jgi:hypothetical protein